jgi:hypothetical protein
VAKPNRRARRNAKVRERKRLIEEPTTSSEWNKPEKSDDGLPVVADAVISAGNPASGSPTETQPPKKGKQYREYGMRMLKAVWRFIAWLFMGMVGFLDKYDGAVTAIATIAIGFLTYEYVTYSKKQWETMQASNELTKQSLSIAVDTLVSSHRPWVFILDNAVTATKPLSFDAAGRAYGTISYSIKNIGGSPALNVSGVPEIRIGKINMLMKEKTPWTDPNRLARLSERGGSFLVPNQSVPSNPNAAIAGEWYFPKNFPERLIPNFKADPAAVLLELCVLYRDEFSRPHATCDYWNYTTKDAKMEFLPKDTVEGQWVHFPFGSVAY